MITVSALKGNKRRQ